MSECTHNCSTCSKNCSSKQAPQDLRFPTNELSSIKKVIGIVSGKGGVGKSLVTSLLAVEASRRDFKTAILDADITGPSIPKMFGITEKAGGDEQYIYPVKSKMGTEIISVNLLIDDETSPVIWRGPVIAGVVKQLYQDVVWNDVDYMFVDMPPGTGDVPLTVFQSLPLDGIVIVTSPQELVSMIVAKAVNMAKKMNVPILGLVENMSYVKCPHCDEKFEIFGESHTQEIAEKYGTKLLAKIPFDREISKLSDNGCIELIEGEWLKDAADEIFG
ncbi:MAG: Mrp/NBP35 family ATP-binding protein [Oscillospiraceae bacterium]|nr:Mrp/NBP35 family ATP-binding protein [Oscillospiraceae bacterium]